MELSQSETPIDDVIVCKFNNNEVIPLH